MRIGSLSRHGFDLATAAIALAIAGALAVAHHSQPRGKPQDTVIRLFAALSSKDLSAVRAQLSPAAYDDFLRAFGEDKYQRVTWAYDQAYRQGAWRWNELRDRAHSQASLAYDQLRMRVVSLGKEAFAALPTDQRMKLMDNQEQYNEFLFEQGILRLSATDRSRIGSPVEFRLSQDRGKFLEREGFAALSADDKKIAGSAAALVDGQTDEKNALHDKFGLPQLSAELRNEIGITTRTDLKDPLGFKLKHGKPLAESFLKTRQIPSMVALKSCTYPAVTKGGSLLKGKDAICQLAVPLREKTQVISIALTKQGADWCIVSINPNLTEIGW